eukprot:m.52168 g.52168  ORF g.52168 m.52168 type:complete len:56 (-) comp15391_c0_seq2:393-560(-)
MPRVMQLDSCFERLLAGLWLRIPARKDKEPLHFGFLLQKSVNYADLQGDSPKCVQ